MVHSDWNYSIASFFSSFCMYLFSFFSFISVTPLLPFLTQSSVEGRFVAHTHIKRMISFYPSEKIPLHLFYWLHARYIFYDYFSKLYGATKFTGFKSTVDIFSVKKSNFFFKVSFMQIKALHEHWKRDIRGSNITLCAAVFIHLFYAIYAMMRV